MRTLILKAFCVAAMFAIEGGCCASSLPASIDDSLYRLETFYAQRASTTSRVQLMIVSPKVFLDPPPTTDKFPLKANVTISVEAPSAYSFVKLVAVDLRSTKWNEVPEPGYPRWYWRIIDPSGNVVIDMLIDEENSAICHANAWYVVDRKLINRLTRGFIDFATKPLLMPKPNTSGMRKGSGWTKPMGSGLGVWG